jgi:hypothetical protein
MLSLASKIGYLIPIVSDEDQNPKPKPKTTQNPKSPKPKPPKNQKIWYCKIPIHERLSSF